MNTNILIIDDDIDYINATQCFLELEGHVVSTATNAPDGWKIIKEIKPDILLIDWQMPDVNGIELIKMLKSLNEYRDVYVIMVSGRSSPSDKVVGIMSGADDYLGKPIVPHELLARIQAGVRILNLQRDLGEQIRKNTVLEMALSVTDKIGNPLSAGWMLQQFLKNNIHQLKESEIEQSLDDLGKVFQEVQVLLKQYLSIKNPQSVPAAGGKKMIDPTAS